MWDATYCSPEIGASILLQAIVKGRMFQELGALFKPGTGIEKGL
jgi:hypothetical protein